MHKTILVAGLAMALSAGAVAAQTPAPAPAPAQRAAPAGPPAGSDGPRFHRGFRGGGDGFHGRRFRQPPSPEEVQRRTTETFTRMDANRDGRVTFEEFRADMERQRMERQRRMFQRFSGGQDSVTLDQLKARALERQHDRQERRERRGRGGSQGRPPAPPASPAR
jgi:hypothetical protein